MSDLTDFTLTFIGDRPNEAARILGKLSPQTTAALFEALPISLALKVIEHLQPEYTALFLTRLSRDKTLELIENMPAELSASILRMSEDAELEGIMLDLDENKKTALLRQLDYPEHMVGAWMAFDAMEIPEDYLVGDARKFLRRLGRKVDHQIYVIRKDGSLAGLINLASLALTKDNLPVTKLLITHFTVLSDHFFVEALRNLPDWDRFESLPVVDRSGKLIGTLAHSNFQRALARQKAPAEDWNMADTIAALIETYAAVITRLLEIILSLPYFREKPLKRGVHGK